LSGLSGDRHQGRQARQAFSKPDGHRPVGAQRSRFAHCGWPTNHTWQGPWRSPRLPRRRIGAFQPRPGDRGSVRVRRARGARPSQRPDTLPLQELSAWHRPVPRIIHESHGPAASARCGQRVASLTLPVNVYEPCRGRALSLNNPGCWSETNSPGGESGLWEIRAQNTTVRRLLAQAHRPKWPHRSDEILSL